MEFNNNTLFLIIGVTVVLGVVMYVNKNSNNKYIDEIPNISNDKKDYEEAKFLIDEFIQEKNWEVLEAKLDSLTSKKFPDLKQKIEEALKNR